MSGTWSVANGTYGSTTAGGTNISVIAQYRRVHPASEPTENLAFSETLLRARVLNQGSDDAHHVGVVYGYQDPQNYHEVIILAVATAAAP